MKHHQHAAAGLVGKRRQKQLQRPVPHLHLRLGVVGSLEGQGLLEGIDLTEEGIVGSALRHTAMEHIGGGGIAVDKEAVVVKGHHAVGHVEEQGVQLVPLVLHGGQRGLKDISHLVEGAREDADLVSGLHGELAVKVSRATRSAPAVSFSMGPTMVLDSRKLNRTEISRPITSACMMMRKSWEFRSVTVSLLSRM